MKYLKENLNNNIKDNYINNIFDDSTKHNIAATRDDTTAANYNAKKLRINK